MKMPKRLRIGDRVATVSLSWGGAGDEELRWRYELGKQRLEQVFGLTVVEMPNTLRGSRYLADHPEKRAEDLMQAFIDPSIKGIFSCIGGNDSIRLLPYLDLAEIAKHPKIFLGYSDSTVTHLVCHAAGFPSFYGPSILAEFAENCELYPYTARWVHRMLFTDDTDILVEPPDYWTSERIPWTEENKMVRKQLQAFEGYRVQTGKGIVEGTLLGGCIQVLVNCIGTPIWPDFTDSLVFLESSEGAPSPEEYLSMLRQLASAKLFAQSKGILVGKPYQGLNDDAYLHALQVVLKEEGLEDLPLVTNMAFGHNEPMCVLPIGGMARFDFDAETFTIAQSGVC